MSQHNPLESGPRVDRAAEYTSLQEAVAQALATRVTRQTSAPRAEILDPLGPALGTGLLARRIVTWRGQPAGIVATRSRRTTGA